MKYNELKEKNAKELNDFDGIFFAFSNEQFIEGMKKLGLNEDDKDKVCSFGSGGIILKSRSKAFNDMFKRNSSAMEEALKKPDFLLSALSYELANHEYCITYDFEDTFDALGLTFEDIKAVDGGLDALREAKESAMCCC